jgi:hypothetical protein
MDPSPSEVTADQVADAADISVTLVTDGVERKVTLRVSPRPTSRSGWAEVVRAMSDFVGEHPERFD